MASKLRTGPIRILPNTDGSQVNPLELANKANTHAVTIQSPDTLSADNKIVLPGSDGTAGKVPQTDGSGNWTMQAPIALTTTGTSGAATLTPAEPYVLNVPQYSGGGGGGVNLQTSSYTLVSGDAGKNVIFNISTAATATLPATPPSSTWTANISNEGISVGILTITATANIDGSSGANALVLCASQGISIWTDGTNYFTSRGGPLAGTTITDPSSASTSTLSVVRTGATGLYAVYVAGNLIALYAESTDTGVANGGSAIGAEGHVNNAILARNQSGTKATVDIGNRTGMQYGGGDLLLSTFMTHGSSNYANRPTGASNGSEFYCTDGKNFKDDANPVGSVLASGGHGCKALYQNGGWVTMS